MSHPDPARSAPTFAIAIACIDGRIQPLLQDGLRARWQVDHVDVVTVPGPELAVPAAPPDHPLWAAVGISLERHRSAHLAVVAHTECAASPVDARAQAARLHEAVGAVRRRFPGVDVVGLVVDTARQLVAEAEPLATGR